MQGMGVLTGRRLASYELGAPLGEDGFGPLYEALHLNLERTFALRILSDRFTFAAGFEEQFGRMASVLSSLEHTNLLSLDDFGIDGPYAYLVMPFVEGLTLDAWLRQRPGKPVGPAQFTRLAGQMFAGLSYAHQIGVTHLGLTPRHILMQPNGHLLLANFGLPYLAEQLWIAWNGSRSFGDPAYLAPEQIPGRTPSGVAGDIYSLGVILYRLLTGVLPFNGSPQAILGAKLEGPPPLRASYPDLPAPLEGLVMRALAPAPEDRWASAAEFGGALERALKQVGYLPSSGLPDGQAGGAALRIGNGSPPLLAAPGAGGPAGSNGSPAGIVSPGLAPGRGTPSHSRYAMQSAPAGAYQANPAPPASEPTKVVAWSSAGKNRAAPPPPPPPDWHPAARAKSAVAGDSGRLRGAVGAVLKFLVLLVTLGVLGAAVFYGYTRWFQMEHQAPRPSPTAAPARQPSPTPAPGHRLSYSSQAG